MKRNPEQVAEVVEDVKARICFRIEQERKARGWTQGDLAEVAGMKRGTAQDVLAGKHMMVDHLVRLAIALDMGWVDLMAGPVEVFLLGHKPKASKNHRLRCAECKRTVGPAVKHPGRDEKGKPLPLLCNVCVELRRLRAAVTDLETVPEEEAA